MSDRCDLARGWLLVNGKGGTLSQDQSAAFFVSLGNRDSNPNLLIQSQTFCR